MKELEDNKQTAVQWYADQQDLLRNRLMFGTITVIEYYEMLNDILKKAMILEDDQIVESFQKGMEYGIKLTNSITRKV